MYLSNWLLFSQSRRKYLRANQGITLIELLLVVALIATIGVMTAPFAGQLYQRINLETTTTAAVTALHKAQANSMEGKSDASWGICLTGSTLRVYLGSCLSPTQKEDWSVPSTVMISGLSNVTFSRLRGEPSSALSVTVSNLAGSNTLTANLAGGLW